MGAAATNSHRGEQRNRSGRRLLFVLLFNLAQLPAMSSMEQIVQASALSSRWVSSALTRNGEPAFATSASVTTGTRG